MSHSEKAILNQCLVSLSDQHETLVYRNNTGMAWQGTKVEARIGATVTIEPGMTILRSSRPVRFGLKGSADIIGVSRGRGLAVETKMEKGQQREAQILFERAWVKAGGIYILARSREECMEKFNDYIG